MMIPKKTKKEVVVNPFRPKTGVPRDYTLCHISRGSYEVEKGEFKSCLKVDFDENEEFEKEMQDTIPKKDIWKDNIREYWYVDNSWKDAIVPIAEKYFDKVTKKMRKW